METRRRFATIAALLVFVVASCSRERTTGPTEPKHPLDSVIGKTWEIKTLVLTCDTTRLLDSFTVVDDLCEEDFLFDRDSADLFLDHFMRDTSFTRFRGDTMQFIWLGFDSVGRCHSTAFVMFQGVINPTHWFLDQWFEMVSQNCDYGFCVRLRVVFDLVGDSSQCGTEVTPKSGVPSRNNSNFWTIPPHQGLNVTIPTK